MVGCFVSSDTTASMLRNPQVCQMTTGNERVTVDAGDEKKQSTAQHNTSLWTNQSYILKNLGIPAMQKMLSEECRVLSRKETNLLKKRFRRRFKPTDAAIADILRASRDGHFLPSPEFEPIEPQLEASETFATNQNFSVGHVDETSCIFRDNKRQRLNEHTNRSTGQTTEMDPDNCFDETSLSLPLDQTPSTHCQLSVDWTDISISTNATGQFFDGFINRLDVWLTSDDIDFLAKDKTALRLRVCAR